MKYCIIGGGLTGLVAAEALSSVPGDTVVLYEMAPVPGGCLASVPARTGDPVEVFYHHCFAGDTGLFALMKDFGVFERLEWLSGSTGSYADGKVWPMTSPLDILRYPHLSLPDIIRLGLFTLRVKKYDIDALDAVPASSFIRKTCGDSVYESFFAPLLTAKFGINADAVSAAWLVSRVAIRSDRGVNGEKLGYLNGGWHTLVDALTERIAKNGSVVHTSHPVQMLTQEDGHWLVDAEAFDAVISTIAPEALATIGGPVIEGISYQGAACMLIGLEREVTGGIYWVNITENAPYGAVIGHTNFVPKERYGEHIVYLASYFTGTPAADLEERMLADFKERFGVKDEEIHWHHLTVEPFAGPIYTTGMKESLPDYERDGLFLAGMFSTPNYPERSIEGSVRAGTEVARRVQEKVRP